jgi:hypothetical protein
MQVDAIQRIKYTDCGDGSFSIDILFADGSTFYENVDVDYDLGSVSVRLPDGSMSTPERDES